ncbi:hypothetical protein J2X55_003048 [Microbacterium sp. 1154]|uniref:hypothetical protein n=1 Tax=Microbacterium sp. 1154 TaxID=2817733 RepID=UPI00285DD089|nr:hypothetical protein [Microbacterium sp. 1154]MDR6692110.1 hypothetical protein [Microbacterium sp. 1154]
MGRSVVPLLRIGIGAGYGSPNIVTLLSERRHDPEAPTGVTDSVIRIEEGYEETWIDGSNVFHNPPHFTHWISRFFLVPRITMGRHSVHRPLPRGAPLEQCFGFCENRAQLARKLTGARDFDGAGPSKIALCPPFVCGPPRTQQS